MNEEIYMTLEEAEQIVMAAEVGMYEGDKSRLAHAYLLIESQEDRKPVLREVVMEFHRWANMPTFHQIIIERDGIKRTYQRPNEGRYTRLNKIIRNHRISLEVDIHAFTEIRFQADKGW